MRRIAQALLGIIVAFGLWGCGNSPTSPSEIPFQCPAEDSTLSWTAFGGYQFQNAGYDDRRFVTSCGWHIYQDHEGGTGDTFEIESPNQAVQMVWAYGKFRSITVTKKWTGATAKGARMGDTKDGFKLLYPEFTYGGVDTLVYRSTYSVFADFDSKKKLYRISVSF